MKFLTLLVVVCSCLHYSEAKDNQPKQQSGAIYGGINSNYTYGNNHVTTFMKLELENLAGNPTFYQKSEKRSISHSAFGFGSFIGYMHHFNKIVCMGDVAFDSTKFKQRLDHQQMSAIDQEDYSAVALNTDFSVLFKRSDVCSGTLRLGYLITPSITLFAKTSLLSSTFYLEYSSENLAKGCKKKLRGIEPGLGFDFNFSNNTFFRGEYGIQIFKKFTTTNIDSHLLGPDDQVIYSVSPRYHVARIGFGYKFKTF